MTANAHRWTAAFVAAVLATGPCVGSESDQAGVRAFYFRDGSPEELKPVAKPPDGMTAQPLADLPLVTTKPAAVAAGGKTFVLDREGLYRVGDLGSKTTTHVLLDRGDLWRIAGHLCRLQVHGWRHDVEDVARWTERARRGRLSISCGNVCRFVAHHLAERGHKARVVQTLTLEPRNGYDDGHVLLEVFDPAEKRWILFDPDMKCRFLKEGRRLSLGDAVALCRGGGQAELDFLAPPVIDAYAEPGAPRESAQYSLLFEATFLDPAARQAWYRRMFQVPVIDGKAGALRPEDAVVTRTLGHPDPIPWSDWTKAAYKQ
jgi:hypothetical protein